MSAPTFPLQANALEAVALVHGNFAKTAQGFLNTQQDHWAANNSVVAGDAFEAGKAKLTELAKNLFNCFASSTNLSDHLYTAAKAQRELERQYDRLTAIAATFGIHISGFLASCTTASPSSAAALAVIRLQLLYLKVQGEFLDQACAAAIRSIGEPIPTNYSNGVFLDGTEHLSIDQLHELAMQQAKPQAELMQILRDHPDARLLEATDGQFAVMFGNTIDPAVITTTVSGKGSGDPSTWASDANRAADMARYTGQPVIFWAGYDPPDSYAEAANPEFAEVGAAQLQKFVQETSERFPEAKQLIVAHSYGSTTAGLAAQQADGLAVDTLILVASPGVHADSATQLKLRSADSKVVVVTNDDDLITGGYPFHGGIYEDFGAPRWDLPGGHSDAFTNETFIGNLQKEVNALAQSSINNSPEVRLSN